MAAYRVERTKDYTVMRNCHLKDTALSLKASLNVFAHPGNVNMDSRYGADGEEISSAQRYRALGNSIALPCADYIMAGIRKVLYEQID